MNKKDITKAQSLPVVMGNELIQKSRYSLSLMEQKALLFMVSKITPNDEPDKEYPFSFSEFEAVCNLNKDGGKSKALVNQMLIGMKMKPIEIRLSEKSRVITSWFNDAVIDEATQTIKISFSKYLIPYLYHLQTFYTLFLLEHTLPMKSKYGIRLYEFICSVRNKGFKQRYSLDEIKTRLGCENDYNKFVDFRIWAIEPALDDINTFTDMEVKVEYIKTGRKVSHIEFTIKRAADGYDRFLNRAEALGNDV